MAERQKRRAKRKNFPCVIFLPVIALWLLFVFNLSVKNNFLDSEVVIAYNKTVGVFIGEDSSLLEWLGQWPRFFSSHKREFNELSIDDVLFMDEEEYRKEFPFPFFWYISGPDTHTVRNNWVAPMHTFVEVFISMLLLTIFRKLVTVCCFAPLARKFGFLEEDKERFYESAINMLYYGVAWSLTAGYLWQTTYFWETIYIFEGGFPNGPLNMFVYFIYILNFGWYFHSIFTLLFWDTIKSDFVPMAVHHVVTLGLLYCSLVAGYQDFGLLVLFSHDICDVFLHLAKTLKYFDNAGLFPFRDQLEIALFLPLPLSWIIFRLGAFPYYVIITVVTIATLIPIERCDYFVYFIGGLCILLLLQVYWFWLVLSVGWNKLLGAEFDDIRDARVEQKKPDKKAA